MGWMFGWGSKQGVVNHLMKCYEFEGQKVIDSAKRSNALYVVVERDGRRTIVVNMIKSYREDGRSQWGYKDICETMGPCDKGCPERLLKLSNCEDGYAPKWREECRQARKAKAGSKSFAKSLKDGDRFMYGGNEIEFAGWMTWRGRQILTGKRDGKLYRYPVSKISPAAPVDAN